MAQRNMVDVTSEPLDDEERRLMDPDNWEDNPVAGENPLAEIAFSPDLGIVLQVRFTKDEARRLAQRARREGRLTTQLIRDVALAYVDAAASQSVGQARE